MSNRLSAARAHILVQEVLAERFAGQGYTGAARINPETGNFQIALERFEDGRRRAYTGEPEFTNPPTEDDFRFQVQLAAETIKPQNASEAPEPAPGSSDPIEVQLSPERPAEAQDGVSA